MLFGYFEIVMDAKIKFPNKFYGKNFTRKMTTFGQSDHFTGFLGVTYIHPCLKQLRYQKKLQVTHSNIILFKTKMIICRFK